MCQEFAVPNCVESATYDPGKSLSESTRGTTHHFQEGNLPGNSKCARCRKACWSAECLTGMRCQWCGLTAHSSCLAGMSSAQAACQFGALEPIFLPPSAISIPRTQLSQNNVLPSKTKDHQTFARKERKTIDGRTLLSCQVDGNYRPLPIAFYLRH